ncbi:MAG: S1 RNA-binding domain-containing protein [Candidatus Moraniibacteriota bacterium]
MKILDNFSEDIAEVKEKITDKKNKKSAPEENKKPVKKVKNQEMEDLLNKTNFFIPKVGELIKGKVIAVTNSAVYVDLGPLGTGIIMGREMKDGLGIVENLNEGDEMEAMVVELENDEGYVELSIREAAYEKAWGELSRKMESRESVSTRILEANRGGLMVEVNGIYGFLPVSQLSHEHYPRVEDGDKNKILQLLLKLVGLEIKVKIIDVDPEDEKLIVSEKATYEEKEKEVIGEFKVGDEVSGMVSGVVDFGAFVKFAPKDKRIEEVEDKDLLEGLVHISELAWQLIEDPHEIIKTGEKVECKIIDIDGTRVSLSIRALKEDPWTKITDKYQVGKIVEGLVTKINPFGAFVQLDRDIHGLAHVSEVLGKIKVKSLNDILEVGKKYNFKILSIEPESHRLGLTLLTKEEEEEYASELGSMKKPAWSAGKETGKSKGKEVKKVKEKTEKKAEKKEIKKEKKVKKAAVKKAKPEKIAKVKQVPKE